MKYVLVVPLINKENIIEEITDVRIDDVLVNDVYYTSLSKNVKCPTLYI